jgi:ATP-dependent Clp protease protease subunit
MLLAEKGKSLQMKAAGIAQKYQEEMAAINAKLQVKETRNKLTATVVDQIEYRTEPLKDGVLYVSDRRIPLNGPIYSGTADYVCDRIDYFNNQSKDLPIFIVIDSSPGGSVMEGYRIVKAIETSPAPVHVVVKSFAASMAAIITTLAPHSYAYPNAVILHHQMSSGMSGNLTQQKEQLENANEWARRLAQPLADKMDVTMDRLVEMMYENNSDGDWEEFADKAVELKWVNHVIHEIREEGIRDQPADAQAPVLFFFQAEDKVDQAGRPVVTRPRTFSYGFEEKVDNEGRPYIMLPRLRPFDYYFMYNPDGYYKWR